MRNFLVTIQYEGSRYQGWQRQENTKNTLQAKFESLLTKLAGEPVEIAASGRTDAGVHAYGQAANFHMDTALTPGQLMGEINRYLPEDVAVVACREVDARFHARLHAKRKVYRYRVLNSDVPHVFDRKFVYQVEKPLNVEAMRAAASFLIGTHDFKSFTSAKKGKKSTVRTVESIAIERVGDEVGSLLEVGLSMREAADLGRVLAACDRGQAGFLAPACGLALMEVFYDT